MHVYFPHWIKRRIFYYLFIILINLVPPKKWQTNIFSLHDFNTKVDKIFISIRAARNTHIVALKSQTHIK